MIPLYTTDVYTVNDYLNDLEEYGMKLKYKEMMKECLRNYIEKQIAEAKNEILPS